MSDTNDLLKIIKQAAIEAIEASKPVNMVFGTVISTSPLQIQIEQKLTLSSDQLVLSRNVTNYQTSIYVDMDTDYRTVSFDFSHTHEIDLKTTKEEDHEHSVKGSTKEKEISLNKSHRHNISGTFNVTINNGLKVNDYVILARMQEGQKYIVLDRIGG